MTGSSATGVGPEAGRSTREGDGMEPTDGAGSRLERLRDRALDLSFRNRLLDAKEGRLIIAAEGADAGAAEDALAGGRRVWLAARDDGSAQAQRRDGRTYLHLDCTRAALGARVVTIYRHANARFEETGLRTCFVGLGALCWEDTGTGGGEPRTRRAPVLLQPVRLCRRQAAGPYWLEAEGEAAPNTTLAEWLAREHGLDLTLPEPLPADGDGVDVPAVLEGIRSWLDGIDPPEGGPRFRVETGALLGIFEFARLALWTELDEIARGGLAKLGGIAQELLGHRAHWASATAPRWTRARSSGGEAGASCPARSRRTPRRPRRWRSPARGAASCWRALRARGSRRPSPTSSRS